MLLASSDVSCAPGSSSRGEDRCAWCGDLMPDGLRAEAKFCSKRCRQAASRSRLKSKPAAPAPSPLPETCAWCGEPMPAGLRREARYCGKRCRQASSRFGLALKRPVPVPAAAQTPGPRDRSRPSPTPAGATRRRRPRREVSDITGLPRSAPYHHAARLGAQDQHLRRPASNFVRRPVYRGEAVVSMTANETTAPEQLQQQLARAASLSLRNREAEASRTLRLGQLPAPSRSRQE